MSNQEQVSKLVKDLNELNSDIQRIQMSTKAFGALPEEGTKAEATAAHCVSNEAAKLVEQAFTHLGVMPPPGPFSVANEDYPPSDVEPALFGSGEIPEYATVRGAAGLHLIPVPEDGVPLLLAAIQAASYKLELARSAFAFAKRQTAIPGARTAYS